MTSQISSFSSILFNISNGYISFQDADDEEEEKENYHLQRTILCD